MKRINKIFQGKINLSYYDRNNEDNNTEFHNLKIYSNLNKQSINDPLLKIFFNSMEQKNIILLINRLTIKYYQRIILNLFFFCFNLFGFYFYEQTLLGCYLSEIECLRINVLKFLSKLLPYLILASLISGVSIALSLWGKISKLHTFFIIIRYYFYYQKDHGTTLVSHGQYNILILGITVFGIVLILSVFFLSKKCLKKGYSCTLLLLIYLILYFLNYESIKGISQCHRWDITLNETNINKPNSNSTCNIIIPKTC